MFSLQEPVLVTGATGFIGSRLMHALLNANIETKALVRPGSAVPQHWLDRQLVLRGNVNNERATTWAMEGIGTLFHLAAHVNDWGPAQAFDDIATKGTRDLLEAAAAQGARVVLTSSIAVYGKALGAGERCDEDRPHGEAVGMYSRMKQAQETIAFELAEQQNLAVTIVRPAVVYGPKSKLWVDSVLDHLRAKRPALVGSKPKNAALTHVENVVDVLLRAARTPAAIGRTYNAADGLDITWERYLTDLANLAELPPPQRISPRVAQLAATLLEKIWRFRRATERPPLTREALNLIGGDLNIPIDRARKELGYTPKVSYTAGLASVAKYIRRKR